MAEKTIDLVSKEYEANSIKEVYSHMGKVGAKNFFKLEGEGKTSGGVTYTIDGAKGTVTANGTKTGAVGIVYRFDVGVLPEDDYILSGDSAETKAAGIYLQLSNEADVNLGFTDGNTHELEFHADGVTGYRIRVYTQSTVNAEDIVLYPMIRPAADTDKTFQTFAKTNRELTKDVSLLPDTLKSGRLLYSDDNGKIAGSGITYDALYTFMNEYRYSEILNGSIYGITGSWQNIQKFDTGVNELAKGELYPMVVVDSDTREDSNGNPYYLGLGVCKVINMKLNSSYAIHYLIDSTVELKYNETFYVHMYVLNIYITDTTIIVEGLLYKGEYRPTYPINDTPNLSAGTLTFLRIHAAGFAEVGGDVDCSDVVQLKSAGGWMAIAKMVI